MFFASPAVFVIFEMTLFYRLHLAAAAAAASLPSHHVYKQFPLV